jgi:hypothetical protein
MRPVAEVRHSKSSHRAHASILLRAVAVGCDYVGGRVLTRGRRSTRHSSAAGRGCRAWAGYPGCDCSAAPAAASCRLPREASDDEQAVAVAVQRISWLPGEGQRSRIGNAHDDLALADPEADRESPSWQPGRAVQDRVTGELCRDQHDVMVVRSAAGLPGDPLAQDRYFGGHAAERPPGVYADCGHAVANSQGFSGGLATTACAIGPGRVTVAELGGTDQALRLPFPRMARCLAPGRGREPDAGPWPLRSCWQPSAEACCSAAARRSSGHRYPSALFSTLAHTWQSWRSQVQDTYSGWPHAGGRHPSPWASVSRVPASAIRCARCLPRRLIRLAGRRGAPEPAAAWRAPRAVPSRIWWHRLGGCHFGSLRLAADRAALSMKASSARSAVITANGWMPRWRAVAI